MPFCINFNPIHLVVESYLSGDVSTRELTDAFYETVMLVSQYNTQLIFTDCSALKGGFSLFDTYPLLKELELSEKYHELKQAIVLPTSAHLTKSFKFWETSCNNRGYRVKTFPCRQIAFYWLLQKVS